jgi:outer membrane lipoprotein-sorting protein
MAIRRAACLALLIVGTAGDGWGAAPPSSGYVEYEMSMGTGQQQQKQVLKMWFKGQRRRQEVVTPQGPQVQLILPEAVYLMTPGSKEATKIPPQAGVKANKANPFGDIEQLKRGSKKVGSEKVGSYDAEIWEHTAEVSDKLSGKSDKVSSRFFIAPGVPVPVKIVQVTPMGLMVTELKQFRTNIAIPDTMFQLPKGTKVSTSRRPASGPFGKEGKADKTGKGKAKGPAPH